MLGSIDKSLSELLKKTANKTKVRFLSYSNSKKRIFRERRANGVAPTVCVYVYMCIRYVYTYDYMHMYVYMYM